ncbi:MAG: ribonuclease Z [Candidatus Omnitrophota bacterium]
MVITLLGTGTGIPSLRRNSPGLLMRLGDKKAVFDSGPGSLRNLLQAGVDLLDLDVVFYTHLHLDHISGFTTILFATKIPPSIRKKALTVYGPKGMKAYYENLKGLYKETICTDAYKLYLEEIENKTIDMDGFKITTRTLEHHGGGMGYRIVTPKGKVVVYSGDTDYCDDVVELSKNADLLILECSSPDEMSMKGHLSPTTAGRVAQQAQAKKVVFVHMYPICDREDLITPCKKEFKGEIVVGEDLMEFDLS